MNKLYSPQGFRRLLNLYPPLFLQRIRVIEIQDDFRRCRVEVRRSWLTANHRGSTFGGSLFAGADPFHAMLFWQIFAHRGIEIHTWLRAARIQYLRPAATTVTMEFLITDDDVSLAEAALVETGKFRKEFRVEAVDRAGKVCTVVHPEVHLQARDSSAD